MKQKYTLSTVAIVLILLTVFGVGAAFASPGDIDLTFRSGGFVTSAFSGEGYASTIQADNKLIVVGRTISSNGGGEYTLLRYNADGTLDASFGVNGRVTTDIEGDNEIPFDAAVQPDGKIRRLSLKTDAARL